jgi:Raf kinase inhibitor-like YbhB/YbcL family protein
MKLFSQSFPDGAPIPGEFAFAVIDAKHHVALSGNRNPHLAWADVPEDTQSFAVICVDPDVPSQGDDVNQEGKTVPAELPRVDFFHWSVIDLSADVNEIAAGSHSHGVTTRGKAGPRAPGDATWRHGLNDYTGWFANDHDMNGDYYGYDGPCPPWNDTLRHRYVFTVYALDVPTLDIKGTINGPSVLAAMQGHVLAQASLTGTYSLNPQVA